MLEGLNEGRIVHYTLSEDDVRNSSVGATSLCAGEVIPAIVICCFRNLQRDDGYANLTGFPDAPYTLHLLSKTFSENGEPGTWKWSFKSTARAKD